MVTDRRPQSDPSLWMAYFQPLFGVILKGCLYPLLNSFLLTDGEPGWDVALIRLCLGDHMACIAV